MKKDDLYTFRYTGLKSFWTIKFSKDLVHKKRNKKRKCFRKYKPCKYK